MTTYFVPKETVGCVVKGKSTFVAFITTMDLTFSEREVIANPEGKRKYHGKARYTKKVDRLAKEGHTVFQRRHKGKTYTLAVKLNPVEEDFNERWAQHKVEFAKREAEQERQAYMNKW